MPRSVSSLLVITAMARVSRYSSISGPTPPATICGTAAITSASEPNGASNVAWQGRRG
jgi:hypothetical protein